MPVYVSISCRPLAHHLEFVNEGQPSLETPCMTYICEGARSVCYNSSQLKVNITNVLGLGLGQVFQYGCREAASNACVKLILK